MERLKRRAAFKAVAGGRRTRRPGFELQAVTLGGQSRSRPPRFGFTVTRKVGNAVVRNRIRRRLKEAVGAAAAGHAEAATDYVLIGRRAALTLHFDRLVTDLIGGFVALARGERPGNRSR